MKIVLVGDGGVGKTTLLRRYTRGNFENPLMTVGADFAVVEYNLSDEEVTICFWDLGGEKRFRDVAPAFCAGAHGAVLVFDLSRYSSFTSLDEWLRILRNVTGDIPIVVVGAKCDLRRSVTTELAQRYVASKGLDAYFEVSSKRDVGVREAFEYIIDRAVKKARSSHFSWQQF